MSAISKALRNAVHQHAPTTLMGMQQRLFSLWFNSFIYNQIWEDPAVDLQALALTPESRVLCIASGGCNVLNYLAASPAHITAIDLNPYHLSLTRLKLAAMKHLPDHAAFYDFFGYADGAGNLENYERYIRPHLDAELDAFWEGRSMVGRKRLHMFRDGLYRHSRFGYFMRLLHGIARRTHYHPERLLSAQSLDEQKAIFQRHIAPFFDNRLVKFLGKLPVSVFSLGIPPQQYKAMKAQGDLIGQYRERVERLACQFPIQDNYFAWQGFSHSYDHVKRQAIPPYLRADNYDLIRGQLGKVDTQLGSMIDFLREQPAHSYDRFVFLDAQDWMSDEVLCQLWREVERTGKPGTRVIFRTAAAESPLDSALPPELLARFSYEAETSKTLFQQDRSAIYGGFHLYRKAG
ncbi:MAG: S-adenosylmethionine--diacylglycerol 3-amino-3-carboxypropyl transferase [Gammaproteobacteria bacterium RIFOXYA12_FULL_61_12]|nr:MAG: S-adenosylmethionine--diacylglycerol 3-amino-3-carboxypropyl transferase [Gammaproteobacteria bacterium RIFOXYD12_FULL_61_37]OGT90644.1 MAG: S-adenosylmethionine--diacylglycerol 3-amino-3-carboxypropyl transferase [Gammaproteobacteria bacterium RIFOXYA12_FULL_61_12]